jgi:hypothetical protein
MNRPSRDTVVLWARRALVAVLAVTMLVFTALWTALHVLAPQKLKRLIETSTSAFLHRTLTVESVVCAPFPALELRGTGAKLTDKAGRVIAESPTVIARASALSLLRLHLGVDLIDFREPRLNLWYERDGRLNIEHIIEDINAAPRSVGRRSGAPMLLFHRFRISDGRLRLADAPGAPPVLDGRANGVITLKFSPLGLRGVPYELDVDEGESGARVNAKGRFGAFPQFSLRAERFPVRALAPRLKLFSECGGTANVRLDWQGGARRPQFDFSISPAGVCGDRGPLPDRVSGRARRDSNAWALTMDANGTDTDLHAEGTLPAAPQPIRFSVTGPRAGLASVMAWSSAVSGLARHADEDGAPSTGPARPVEVAVSVSSVSWLGVTASSVAFTVHRAKAGAFLVEPATLAVFRGTAEGTATIGNGSVHLDLHAHDWQLADVAAAFGSTGTLKGDLSIALVGDTPLGQPPLSAFAGQAEIWMKDFELDRVPAIFKILTSASFVKLEEKIKGQKTGFPPAEGNGKADVSGGVAHIDRLQLENRVLRIGYSGEVRFVAHEIDGTMAVQALTAADQIINDIPVVRDLVLGKGKSLIPLWFRLQGPWADPRIRSLPVKSLETPILRIFRGLIDLPQDVIDTIRGKD